MRSKQVMNVRVEEKTVSAKVNTVETGLATRIPYLTFPSRVLSPALSLVGSCIGVEEWRANHSLYRLVGRL